LEYQDVKPENVPTSMSKPVQMKLSDFGLAKRTSSRGTFSQSGVKGTWDWFAPEMLEDVNAKESSEKSQKLE
jgi:serine/threonine protein kinase